MPWLDKECLFVSGMPDWSRKKLYGVVSFSTDHISYLETYLRLEILYTHIKKDVGKLD